MSIESIQKGLTERFAAPLDEYHKRHIVFWEDSEQKFSEEIDALSLDGVKIVKLNGANYFYVKKLLLHDDKESDFLIYDPCGVKDNEDDWLYDIRLYSGEPFFADKMSLQMDEFGIDSNAEMRNALTYYPKFFDNKERRDKFKSYGKKYNTAYALHMDILCALCNIPSGSIQDVITAILLEGTDENKYYEQIERFGNAGVFWQMIHRATGFVMNPDENNLPNLAAHIFFTASTQSITGSLKQFNDHISTAHASFCYGLVHDLIYYQNEKKVYSLCKSIELRFSLPDKFKRYEVSEIADCDSFPCIDECILRHFLEEIQNDIIKADDIITTVEKRRTLKWYDKLSSYYDGLLQIAQMQKIYQTWYGNFHEVEPSKVWKLYTTELYRMDTCYRKFHLAFGESLKASLIDIEDEYKEACEIVENLYQNWYLKELTAMWLKAADEYLLDYNKCSIFRQNSFYHDVISKEQDNHTTFVIISDALRYEVAEELKRILEEQNRGKVTMSSMKSVFPSVTRYGMAALLPGKDKVVSVDGEILIDSLPCESTEQRKAVLQAADANSTAIQYKDFIAMKKDERNSTITGNRVIYIYHNTIDAIGDKAPTETKVFEACEDAISELQNLIRIISGIRTGSRIIVTADHGFMYTYKPLMESQKISKSGMNDVLKNGRRYIVGTENTQSDVLLPVQMEINNADNSLIGLSPRDTVRIKMSGGGENFVHGGASLQEMCVPVLTFKSVRLDSKMFQSNKEQYETTPVSLSLLATTRKISNMIFSLYFLQNESVGKSKKAATFEAYFVDEYYNKISDVQKIVADKTSDEAKDRQFRCLFNLKSLSYDKNAKYYLIVIDEQSKEIIKEEYQIDIAFAVDDFGF